MHGRLPLGMPPVREAVDVGWAGKVSTGRAKQGSQVDHETQDSMKRGHLGLGVLDLPCILLFIDMLLHLLVLLDEVGTNDGEWQRKHYQAYQHRRCPYELPHVSGGHHIPVTNLAGHM